MKNEELDKFDEAQAQPQQPTLKFTATVDEVNLIFRALSELPHRVADPIMRNLMAQVQSQIETAN